METLDDALVLEQNKMTSSGAWIWLLQIPYGTDNTLIFANNSSTVLWDGVYYQPMSFTMSDITESTSGKFPEYKLQIGDAYTGSNFRTALRTYNGLVGRVIRLMVVHSDHLDLTTPAIDEVAEILNCEVTAEAITFTIGMPSMLSRRFPRDRYVPGFCRHKFAGALCQYVQPSHAIAPSTQVSFTVGSVASGDAPAFNRINVSGGSLVTDVFQYAAGTAVGSVWQLAKDTVFMVSGSVSNDGWFIAENYFAVLPGYVAVIPEADGARPFVAEPVGASVTIRLGYGGCDHTLEACALRDNTEHYGGSPGIIGGMYG